MWLKSGKGLRRLEYRGYDSRRCCRVQRQPAAAAVRLGKVAELARRWTEQSVHGGTGIAHTAGLPRRAVRAQCSPHVSEHIVVYNGIIENHEELREELKAQLVTSSAPTPTPR